MLWTRHQCSQESRERNTLMINRKIVENTIAQLRDVQNGLTWYDDNFEKKIGWIAEEQAFIRPIPEIHSVAELVSHVLVWRLDTVKRLEGLDSNFTVESPENWKDNEELRKTGWEQLKQDLSKSQEELIDFLTNKTDDYLENTKCHGEYSVKAMVEGIIHHDLYHLGQVGITIKLLKLKYNLC